MENFNIKKILKQNLEKITKVSSCCSDHNSCCRCNSFVDLKESDIKAESISEKLELVPEEPFLDLKFDDTLDIDMIKKGEIVLILGSGAGIDCFIASMQTGPEGKIIGIDMAPEMIEKSKINAAKEGFKNIEFKLGKIGELPVESSSVDAFISNCAINIVFDKKIAFKEAFRVLKPNGKIVVSDIVIIREIPEQIKNYLDAYTGCLSGAIMLENYIEYIARAGFGQINIIEKKVFPVKLFFNDKSSIELVNNLNLSHKELDEIESSIVTIKISAVKTKN